VGLLRRRGAGAAEVYLFLAALWCGVLTAFAGGAGIVLRASPSRSAGGAVNRALVDAVDESSYVAIGLLFVLFFVVERSGGFSKLARGLTIRLLVVAAAATIVSHLLVTPELAALRDRASVALDALAKDDPIRRDFGRLHGLSALALLLRMGCAAGIFALGARASAAQDAQS
jgi:hypothetical protein